MRPEMRNRNEKGIHKMSSIAIITARGGSKRIPRKNIKDFFGQPIIAYSIKAARDADCFDEIMVSTDDHEIAEIAQKYGADVPFFRSPETSTDYATTLQVTQEVIGTYGKNGKYFDYGCCIYPTAPFINPQKLNHGMKTLIEGNYDAATPVVAFSYPVQRALCIREEKLTMMHPEHANSRSQDLEKAYHDIGQYYCFKTAKLFEITTFLSGNVYPIITPASEVQDIDTEEDWKTAEIKYKILNSNSAF
jgi:N-acylneuraminate cytidylyltransferase